MFQLVQQQQHISALYKMLIFPLFFLFFFLTFRALFKSQILSINYVNMDKNFLKLIRIDRFKFATNLIRTRCDYLYITLILPIQEVWSILFWVLFVPYQTLKLDIHLKGLAETVQILLSPLLSIRNIRNFNQNKITAAFIYAYFHFHFYRCSCS